MPDTDEERVFDSVPEAVAAIARGGIVVVVDDESRENEGDLVMAAEFATTATTAFFVRHTSGFLCVAMPDSRADALELPLMVPDESNGESLRTAFTVSVDAAEGVTTGISARDRGRTIRLLADPDCSPDDLVRPGHVMALRARSGGVLERPGHTEATVDLCTLAGAAPVGLLCELLAEDGEMARRPALLAFAREHDLPIITVAQIAAHRRRLESGVVEVATCTLPTRVGTFAAHAFRGADGTEHLALVHGDPAADSTPLVRLHSECLTGDVLGSVRCDCGSQLEDALDTIVAAGSGVLLYHRGHEGRGIGLAAKIAAYALQERGHDTVDANLALGLPADAREYGTAAGMLHHLGLARVRLLTNNPDKVDALRAAGIDVVERVARPSAVTAENVAYLRTKNERMGHRIAVLTGT
ncbi:GTP cyclohydrolase II [Pseudonocardia lutea]|uniref:Multifunctional fusion protein n=1 Tax=Pseudonocardia lutea TaxID=2172015 RepID=A0ABW1IBS8_9PSEU